MVLELPSHKRIRKTFCSYFEFEREYEGDRVIKETMVASKAWIKDLKKKEKKTKAKTIIMMEDEGEM